LSAVFAVAAAAVESAVAAAAVQLAAACCAAMLMRQSQWSADVSEAALPTQAPGTQHQHSSSSSAEAPSSTGYVSVDLKFAVFQLPDAYVKMDRRPAQ
jgi:hypothetical protein